MAELNLVISVLVTSVRWTEPSNFRMFYMLFGKLVLVIFNEFLSQFAELNVVIFNNLTSVRRTDPSTELLIL